jgi:uncharacterized protein YutE (UPF0331/DUF86 family)
MIDRALVTRKSLLILKDLEEMARVAAAPRDAFILSRHDQAAAERFLERAIGRMIDINYHLLTESGNAPPPDYYQSFTELVRLGVLDADFGARIASSAGLRNRIVHEYEDIDPSRIYDALHAALREVPDYLARVDQFVERLPSRNSP